MKKFEAINYLNAGYPALWLVTSEPDRAEMVVAREAEKWNEKEETKISPVLRWNCLQGLVPVTEVGQDASNQDAPTEIIHNLVKLPVRTIVFLENFHKFVGAADVIQALSNMRDLYKQRQIMVIVIAPDTSSIPAELSKLFQVVRFELPTAEELKEVFSRILEDVGQEVGQEELNNLAEAAVGLTLFEAENAAAYCLATNEDGLTTREIAEAKANMIRQSATLEVGRFEETFEGLKGMDKMKDFALRSMKSDMYRGILVLGPAGTGKSHFAKALGNATNLPTVIADVNKIMAAGQALVGQAEAKAQQTVDIINSQGKAVVMFDEIEKGLSAAYSGHQGDGGAKAGVGSILLRWFSDRRQGGQYVCATCNDISQLPPEWLRAERWDAIFFVDLPDEDTRMEILNLYCDQFGIEDKKISKSLEGWTGAEIKTMCRISKMLDINLDAAHEYVIPVSQTSKEKIEALRAWAKGRAVSAERCAADKFTMVRKITKK